jgi:L,D-peptidoglycan transpeptidase YkuD (ErfK/YbiS/YcfS/YnhG family)
MLQRFEFGLAVIVFSIFFISCLSSAEMPENASILKIKDSQGLKSPVSMPLQAIVVKTADWSASAALLQRYEKKHGDATWEAVGEKIPAVVGRNGLGWGTGIHPLTTAFGPVKQEGDGKSPAGIFLFGDAFGYAPVDEVPWIKLPYRQAASHLHCVDDVRSIHYNRLVDTKKVEKNWQSYEEMRRPDDQYRLGLVVQHNTDPVVAGQGSCIFLHVWTGPDVGTSGCTAVEARQMEALLRWLDPQAKPVLIQLPESEYVRLRSTWRLP